MKAAVLVPVLCIGLVIAVAVVQHKISPSLDVPTSAPIEQSAYVPPESSTHIAGPVRFTEVTQQSGIRFSHYNGNFIAPDGKESRYVPEPMGPGVVLLDYNGDGRLDIFVANGCDFPGHKHPGELPTAHLYRNDGGLHFSDVSNQSGLALVAYGMGGAAADYDGDGHIDLVVTTLGGPRLFHNNGNGTFSEVTDTVGLRSEGWVDAESRRGSEWSTGAMFFDADGDGWLDLLVLNYLQWSPETDVYTSIDGRHKSYTDPRFYPGTSLRLFAQRHGKFADITSGAGLSSPHGKALGVSMWDFENSGRPAIVVANDMEPNQLFENLGEGKFREHAIEAGIAYDENGAVRSGMGIDVGDYLNDGTAAVAIGNLSGQGATLFKTRHSGFFGEASYVSGVGAPTFRLTTFGLAMADLDLDGWLDLLLANGHLEPRIEVIESEFKFRETPTILGNQRNGKFADWSADAGPAFQAPMLGRGLALGDLDGDGDLDVVIAENNGPLHVLRNDTPRANHYLRVRLRGSAPNTDAIGARIKVVAKDVAQQRMVRTGSSYMSQSEIDQTFGLGAATALDAVLVTWPDGSTTRIENPLIDHELLVQQGMPIAGKRGSAGQRSDKSLD